MTLLEDLQSGKYNLVLIGIIIGLLFYCFPSTIETFADAVPAVATPSTDPVLLATIKDQIRKIYLADVDSIRNLSEVATKLTTTGLTISGNLMVSGKIYNTDDLNITGDKALIISNKTGVNISKILGGNGNLNVEGSLTVGSSLLLPAVTTIDRDAFTSLSQGMIVYNKDINVASPQIYNGSTWNTVNSTPLTIIADANPDLSDFPSSHILIIPSTSTTALGTVKLPKSPYNGQTVEVHNAATTDCIVSGNGANFFRTTTQSFTLNTGGSSKFIYNGQSKIWIPIRSMAQIPI